MITERDEEFTRLTGMVSPGHDEASVKADPTTYTRNEVREELWRLYCRMKDEQKPDAKNASLRRRIRESGARLAADLGMQPIVGEAIIDVLLKGLTNEAQSAK